MRSLIRVIVVVFVFLFPCFRGEAAVFTAGTGGTYPTIQGAINAALAAGGEAAAAE